MNSPQAIQAQESDDALLSYRQRVVFAFGLLAAAVLVPFVVNNFAQGRFILGVGTLACVILLAMNALALRLKRRSPLPFWLIVIPIIVAIGLSIRDQGFYGALWSYPTLLLFQLSLRRRIANACCLALLACITWAVFRYIGAEESVRFFITMTLTVILINIALRIIDDLHRRLLEQTIRDPLTGAYNRRHMETVLDYMIQRSHRTGSMSSLLLIDVDHFKRINDGYGHAQGDRVLKEMAALMSIRARKTDLLFRIGGEEFLLLLPDTRESDAAIVAENLRAAIESAPLLEERAVTVSIGVSQLESDDSRDVWLKHADDALYLAKNSGRNRVMQRVAARLAEAQ